MVQPHRRRLRRNHDPSRHRRHPTDHTDQTGAKVVDTDPAATRRYADTGLEGQTPPTPTPCSPTTTSRTSPLPATGTATTQPCAPTETIIHISGTITTDTTWTPGACADVYLLDTTTSIAANTTLTINPGTTIKSGSNAALNVYRHLVAHGSAADPVVFTSLLDDSVGGEPMISGRSTPRCTLEWGKR